MAEPPPTWDRKPDLRLILTTLPPHRAEAVAKQLVESCVAACVNVVPGLRSHYRWQGSVANDPESLLIVKTPADRLEAAVAALRAQHPYDTPEVVVIEPLAVEAAYADWVRRATGPEAGLPPKSPRRD